MPPKRSKPSKRAPAPSSSSLASSPQIPTPHTVRTVQSYIKFDIPSTEATYASASTIGDVKKDTIKIAFDKLEKICGTELPGGESKCSITWQTGELFGCDGDIYPSADIILSEPENAIEIGNVKPSDSVVTLYVHPEIEHFFHSINAVSHKLKLSERSRSDTESRLAAVQSELAKVNRELEEMRVLDGMSLRLVSMLC